MDRGYALLQGLRVQLERWTDTIRKATCATAVSFVPQTEGEFALRIEWKLKTGEVKTFDRVFTRREVFGASYRRQPHAWQVERRACDYARDCIQKVLTERGV
jgi:hypothetical protein